MHRNYIYLYAVEIKQINIKHLMLNSKKVGPSCVSKTLALTVLK